MEIRSTSRHSTCVKLSKSLIFFRHWGRKIRDDTAQTAKNFSTKTHDITTLSQYQHSLRAGSLSVSFFSLARFVRRLENRGSATKILARIAH